MPGNRRKNRARCTKFVKLPFRCSCKLLLAPSGCVPLLFVTVEKRPSSKPCSAVVSRSPWLLPGKSAPHVVRVVGGQLQPVTPGVVEVAGEGLGEGLRDDGPQLVAGVVVDGMGLDVLQEGEEGGAVDPEGDAVETGGGAVAAG